MIYIAARDETISDPRQNLPGHCSDPLCTSLAASAAVNISYHTHRHAHTQTHIHT